MIPFSPAPTSADWPPRFPSPFDRGAVHPMALRAAHEVMHALHTSDAASWQLHAPGNGKMFGVLVVADARGATGYLRAFSGMVNGQWDIESWAPPAFDHGARSMVWVPGEAEMLEYSARRATLRSQLASAESETGAHAPDALRLATAIRELDAERTARSRVLMRQIQDTYHFANALGDVRALRDIFSPQEPPAGAGDCAAPKLLAQAYREGLTPLALAEFWWGAPPSTGDRREGAFYAACRGKCLPILTHMLQGLPADPPPEYGAAPFPPHEPVVVYEDAHLLVVDKPSGMLSVPGRGPTMQDCVMMRLRARYPEATGQMVVHRLDLDTSGLLLAAKSPAIASALQRLFSLREVEKHYVAWLDGAVQGAHGHVRLPLRMDVEDRPRNIHDPVHGKPAETEWRVLSRDGERTRVQFIPHTGRTHQLRVHAAHPQGLDAPIVGDRLYGRAAPREDERLLLHAERLAFVHPITGKFLEIVQPAPF